MPGKGFRYNPKFFGVGLSPIIGNGDLYITANNIGTYKQDLGAGPFNLEVNDPDFELGVAVNAVNQDVFICTTGGSVGLYKQTGGIGSFVLYQSGAYRSVEVNSNTKDVFIVENGVDLFKQSGGTGPFVAQGTGFTSIDDVAVNHTTNDVFITVDDTGVGKILKQTGGTGSFVDQGAPNINWNFIAVSG